MARIYGKHPLDVALQRLPEDASPQERLAVVWRMYVALTGDSLSGEPSVEERQKVVEWLRLLRADFSRRLMEDENNPGIPEPYFLTTRTHFAVPVAESIPDKASRLTTHMCNACDPIIHDGGRPPLMLHMPIRVPPWSAQSVGARNKILVDAIREQLQQRQHQEPWADSPICLSIAAVVPRSLSRYTKDVDNLVKGLLDALAGVLYVNDKQVQCLTTRRFEYAGDVGYYTLAATAVHPWDVDVIYDGPKVPYIMSGFIDLPEQSARTE